MSQLTSESVGYAVRFEREGAASLLALRRGHAQRHGLHPETLGQVRDISQQLRSLRGLPLTTEEPPRLEKLALFLARH